MKRSIPATSPVRSTCTRVRPGIASRGVLFVGLVSLTSCSGGQRFGNTEEVSTSPAPTTGPHASGVDSAPEVSSPVVDPDIAPRPVADAMTGGGSEADAGATGEPTAVSPGAQGDPSGVDPSAGNPDTVSTVNPDPTAPDSVSPDSVSPDPSAPVISPSTGVPGPPVAPCEAEGSCTPDEGADAMTPPPAASEDSGTTPSDECPEHPSQLLSGPCGCGFPSDVSCEIFKSHLIHRYSFESSGTDIIDSVRGANGRSIDTSLDGSGTLELNGGTGYAELPSGLLAGLTVATFEVWLRWDGGSANQRVFNFGTPGSDERDSPESYLSLSPSSGDDAQVTVQLRTGNGQGDRIYGYDALPRDIVHHVVVVVDQDRVELYVEGERVEQRSTSHRLHELRDSVNWLGRPLYDGYPSLDGALYEFRIYDAPLSKEEIAVNALLGPDAVLPHAP